MPPLTYEEKYRRVGRWLRRAQRAAVWRWKGILGIERRVLVEIRWRLGDEVMAVPIYEALRTRYPTGRITVWCTYPELLEGNPFVDAVNDPTPAPDLYLLLREGPRGVNRIEHYARLAGVPTPASPPRLYYHDWSCSLLDDIQRGDGPLIAVASGASWPTKRWSLDQWRRLCQDLVAAGYRIVELGHGDDPIHVGACLVDRTTVREAACVLHAASMVVCCDSGLMHLALAVGTPVLALFGPTLHTILSRDDRNLLVIDNGRDCQGCWNRMQMVEEGVCPLSIPDCLGTITSEVVFTRIREFFRGEL